MRRDPYMPMIQHSQESPMLMSAMLIHGFDLAFHPRCEKRLGSSKNWGGTVRAI